MARDFSQSSSQYLLSIDAEIERLQLLREHVASIVSAETSTVPSRKPGRPAKSARKTMSDEGRRKIAEAQKARWARQKAARKNVSKKAVAEKSAAKKTPMKTTAAE